MEKPNAPHAPIYDAPEIIWETDPAKMADDPAIQKLIAAHKAGNFRDNLRGELVKISPFLNAVSQKINGETKPKTEGNFLNKILQKIHLEHPHRPADLLETYATNAHYTRAIVTSKLFVLPFSAVESLSKIGLRHASAQGLTWFGPYGRDFSFLNQRNIDSDGKDYAMISNCLALSDEVFDALKTYNAQHIMEAYARLFAPTLHDALHGATASTFFRSNNRTSRVDSSEFSQTAPEGDESLAILPKALENWNEHFLFDGYEHMINQTFQRIREELFTPAQRSQITRGAAQFFQDLNILKEKIEKNEGDDKALDICMLLASSYALTLQNAHISLMHPDLAPMRALADQLLPVTATPVFTRLAETIPRFFSGMDSDRVYKVMAEVVRAEKYTAESNPPLKSIWSQLKKAGYVTGEAPHDYEAIAQTLETITPLPFSKWGDGKIAVQCHYDSNLFIRNYALAAFEKLEYPKQEPFWQRYMLAAIGNIDPVYYRRQNATLNALARLGIEWGKPIPEVTRFNALQLNCITGDGGFSESLQAPAKLVFDITDKKKHTATEAEILRHYCNAMHKSIASGEISKNVADAAKEDLRLVRAYTQGLGSGIEPRRV